MAEGNIGVLLVEDDLICRQRLVQAITAQPGLILLSEIGSVVEAMALIKEKVPDVLVVDIGLPDGSGIDLIEHCNTLPEAITCLVVSVHSDEQHVLEALSAGAMGYLLKETPAFELGEAILSASEGDVPISPRIAKALLQKLRPPKDVIVNDEDMKHLTPREEQVLGYLAQGFTRDEIAGKLKVSMNTVGAHTKHIYQKLKVNSGRKAVHKARQYGLLKER
jgi:DNA-binding NarL/FixJ family response regulator